MRTNWILSTAIVATSVTAAVGAQSTKSTEKPSAGGSMSTTYTGCVEAVNHGGTFLLTHVESGGTEAMHREMPMDHHDEMATKTAAKAMRDETPMADEKMDAMPSKSFALAGSAKLNKHVGQKVSVTGSVSDSAMGTMRQDLSTLTVKTLKVIAKSCS